MSRADRHGTDDATAGRAIVEVLTRYAHELPGLLRSATADEPDAVHQARILVRRARSVLGAGKRCFEAGAADGVRDLLEGLGDELGAVRDLEVRIRHAEEHVGVGADETVVDRLIVSERARYRAAHERLTIAVDAAGPVHDALRAFVDAPPMSARGERAAADGLAAVLRHELRRVRRAERRAVGDLESLHRLRRTARRLRYVAEAFTESPVPVFGDESGVAELAEAAKAVQDTLGDHRDAVLFALQVRDAQEAARASDEPTGEYGRIAADAFAAAHSQLEGLSAGLAELWAVAGSGRSAPSGSPG
ncbi:CHAD domain-containing protein [Agromyces intestinalis]|uniref:CHAD domain-containing protein n=1 Tax=Agromyces intestinalis TaxID=2592652 RepID=A0A5C1YCA0_9MICO|nr:CHAD domain-containing protein [Agromyces intestinalis]QEO13238.1 CHAD domain-containing protein [Agromyces intestinalis]